MTPPTFHLKSLNHRRVFVVSSRACVENHFMFDLIRGLAIIVAIFLIGGWLHAHGAPIPGGVLGLLLIYGAMISGVVKLRWVDRAASLLLRHMVLLFVPLTVGLVDLGPLLSHHAGAILASLAVSFLAVLLTTGLLARWLLRPEESLHAQAAEASQ
jgi:holin-like protein